MADCYKCGRKNTKYSCILCDKIICNPCADIAEENEPGYDDDNYRVGKCPNSECQKKIKIKPTTNNKKPNSIHSFFNNNRKRKTKEHVVIDTEKEKKRAKIVDDGEEIVVNNQASSDEDVGNTEQSTEEIMVSSNLVPDEDSKSEQVTSENEIVNQFMKVFSDIEEHQIHHHSICTERGCKDICDADLKAAKKDNKFQHSWLFNPDVARCDKTNQWCLVYIDGKGMFCSLCRKYDITQNNKTKTWNSVPNIRCRTKTVVDHMKKDTSMHCEAVKSFKRQSTSYFDREKEKKINILKNEVYFKVFSSLYWIAKEEVAALKISSLLTLLERMGVNDIKYFETRSEPVLRKMLILIADTIIQDLVDKIKQSDVYALLTDEVTDISNVCQLVSFIKMYDQDKSKAQTVFIDCSDLLEHSPIASPDADAIVTCITKRFEALGIEIKKLKAFVSDGASVMIGSKGGVAQKLRDNFTKTMINIHCICHRLALACGDTGDDYKFINSFEEVLIELWKYFKNSPKRLKVYIRTALKCKEIDTMSKQGQKKLVKKMKKACRTRWLSLHSGVDALYDEYEGVVKTLKEIQTLEGNGTSASKAIGLLKKIKKHEFIGTLYLLKFMLPNLSALSKTFQAGSLNFSRIIPSINKCKTKIKDVAARGKVLTEVKKDLNGRLKSLDLALTATQEQRIKDMVQKYSNSICKSIDARFPANSCETLNSFSMFDIDLLPSQSSQEFTLYGRKEIRCLALQFFPEEPLDIVQEQWNDFKFEMLEMKKKLNNLRGQLECNKIKFKMTSTEWTLEHILKSDLGPDYQKVKELAKLAIIVPVTNAWPERGASAVKRIKTRQRSTMKNDMLNGLLHISMNGPPPNSAEADHLINRVVDKYCQQNHNKVPNIYVERKNFTSVITQTVDADCEEQLIEKFLEKEIIDDEFIISNLTTDSEYESSDSNCEDD